MARSASTTRKAGTMNPRQQFRQNATRRARHAVDMKRAAKLLRSPNPVLRRVGARLLRATRWL